MLVLKKKNLIVISVLLVTALTFVFCFSALSKTSADGAYSYKIKIVLDAGHGGIDGGVCGVNTGVKESDLNLAVVKKLERLLISADFNVVLTRNSSAGLYGIATSNLKRRDMQKRREIIEEADPAMVISLHQNFYPTRNTRGAQVFYSKGNAGGQRLALLMQKELNVLYAKEGARARNAASGQFYMLECSDCPSVLVECGFLSNREDERLLTSEGWQKTLGQTIAASAMSYFSDFTA